MNLKYQFFRPYILALMVCFLLLYSTSCSFEGVPPTPCSFIGGEANAQLTSSERNVSLEDPGTIIVYQGFACAVLNETDNGKDIKVEQKIDLPAYATDATVFHSGWRVEYLNGDHEVEGFGSAVGNIRMEGNTLIWEASGALADKNSDDAYTWCYHYTVVAWNPANLDMTAVQEDADCSEDNDFLQSKFYFADNDGTTTALTSYSSFLQDPVFTSGNSVALLPRGFGYLWDGDHNLLQIGYNLDHSEIFIERDKKYKKSSTDISPLLPDAPSRVDSGFVSWETFAIIKDDKGRRDYRFGELVSGLTGSDVGMIQPPYSILPKEDDGLFGSGCVSSHPDTQEFVIENVPFEYAVPLLTGWELYYACEDDEEIKAAGIWIDEWSFDNDTRTLRYKLSSALHDENKSPGHGRTHKVSILGLKPSPPGPAPSQQIPDLVPFSPSGAGPGAFCRLEQGGNLRVSVKNQGSKAAIASKTTVQFGNTPVIVDTPPIPVGGSVDLLFDIPSGCFSPDCAFDITVDSNNQVNESNHEDNNRTSGECFG